MAKEYVPVFLDWTENTQDLTQEQKGNLIDAVILYAAGGDYESKLQGPEKIAFRFMKGMIDRNGAISESRSKAGSTIKQEQSETNESKQKQTQTNENKRNQTETKSIKEKEKEKEKEEDKENNYDGNSAGAWVTDSDIQESLERDRKIEEAARRWGLPCQEGHMIHARDLARDYTIEWLIRAIETAGGGKEQTWRYVDGILRSYRENGGPDAPRKQRPSAEKTVSAQKYTQRGNDELDPIYFGDSIDNSLLDEARRMRDTG